MSQADIKNAVGDKYSKVAKDPYAKFNFPVGKKFAISVGYPEKILNTLPSSMYESFTGANNPQAFVDLRKGEGVLDLGCGGGLDIYFFSQAIGGQAKVYGLDISADMVAKAKTNMQAVGIENAEIVCGHSDDLPFSDNFFDVVASNGIYNLSPDKEKVMKEVFRVLKPGGRTVFCEIILKKALPENIGKSIDDWFRCIGGAMPEAEILKLMKKIGFRDIEIISKIRNARTGHALAVCANVRAYKPYKEK